MSGWTHALCDADWERLNPGREPHRMLIPEDEVCAVCGESTRSGIYVRMDPHQIEGLRTALRGEAFDD